jgi:hypothetical protein
VFSIAALACAFAGQTTAAWALLGILIGFAALESMLGLCVGCKVFALGIRLGVVPETTCERCVSYL